MPARFANSGGSKLVREIVEQLRKGSKLNRSSSPFVSGTRRRQLKPREVYVSGKPNAVNAQGTPIRYVYQTDAAGNIAKVQARPLQLPVGNKRGYHRSTTKGKLSTDHAGHIIGDRFGGSGQLDNLVSQASSLNLGKYKALEDKWAKLISNGTQVDLDINITYDATGAPSSSASPSILMESAVSPSVWTTIRSHMSTFQDALEGRARDLGGSLGLCRPLS